jgi:hypothetical protein
MSVREAFVIHCRDTPLSCGADVRSQVHRESAAHGPNVTVAPAAAAVISVPATTTHKPVL